MNELNQLTNFEQAKRLKELKFDGTVTKGFRNNGKEVIFAQELNYNVFDVTTSRPTISHALDWCRENHGLFFHPDWLCENGEYKYYFELSNMKDGGYTTAFGKDYQSYPEAQSAALDAALDYIKKQKHQQGGGTI